MRRCIPSKACACLWCVRSYTLAQPCTSSWIKSRGCSYKTLCPHHDSLPFNAKVPISGGTISSSSGGTFSNSSGSAISSSSGGAISSSSGGAISSSSGGAISSSSGGTISSSSGGTISSSNGGTFSGVQRRKTKF
jgi:hypothetical protein